MMIAYFNIKKYPFKQEIKPLDMFPSTIFKETEARLNHIKNHRGIMRLTGEPGSGKTSVLRKWVDSLSPQSFQHCYTPHTTVSKVDLYRQINTMLNLPPKTRKADLF